MDRAHEAVREIHRTNAEAREAIDRYLKQRGVTMDSLSDQSEGFRKDCYGAVRDALQADDWSALTYVQRFDPLASVPAQEPTAKADPIEVVVAVDEEPKAAPEMLSQNEDGNPATLLQKAIEEMIESRSGKSGIDERRFRELFDHEIQNGVEWEKTGVAKLIEERVKDMPAHRFEVKTPSGLIKPVKGLMHQQAVQFATWINADVPLWVWGSAGSGKSTLFYQLADMLDYTDETARLVSVGPTTTASTLIGFCTAGTGDYKEGLLYQPFKEGWLVGLDEPACGDPSILAQLNAMIANERYTFPNGETVKRHDRFRVVCFDNTKGTGATAGYTARARLDAATLDRFAIIEMEYDEALEFAICTGQQPEAPSEQWQGGEAGDHSELCAKWVHWVQAVRAYVGQSVLISPRASLLGVRAIRAGVPIEEVKEALVFKLVSPDTRTRINENVQGV